MRHPEFRRLAIATLVSATGFWMQRVAQDWLVLTELTNDDGLALGIVTGLQFFPFLLLAPYAGALADRAPRRLVMLVAQIGAAASATALGLLVWSGHVRLWHVYVLAALLGVFAAIEGPARQTFVAELVPKDDLVNAVALSGTAFHAARLIGPGLAGLLIQWWGTAPVFFANGASFLVVVAALVMIRPERLLPVERSAAAQQRFRDGLAYLAARKDLLIIMTIMGLNGALAINFAVTTALMARLEFNRGAGQFGLLGSILAIGSVTGTLVAARRKTADARSVALASVVFGAFTGLAAMMPGYTSFAVALVPVGLTALVLMTGANSAVQLGTDVAMRGRAMATYSAVGIGSSVIGTPFVGWVGAVAGARWSLWVGAIVAMVGGAVGYLIDRRDTARKVEAG